MRFQISAIALVLSMVCLSAEAFSPAFVTTSRIATTKASSRSSNSQLFSQWDEDDDDVEEDANTSATAAAAAATNVVKAASSYDEAGKAMGEEDDQAAMDDMGDFDASGTYNVNDIERYKEAIKKRTEALGMEKRTPEEIAAQAENAKDSMSKKGDTLTPAADDKSPDKLSQMLDLSQITSDAPRGPDESLPAMMYNPADDMSKEEMEEADPTGLLPWNEQIAWVFGKSKFPTAAGAITETIILVVTVTITGLVITQWDEWMREVAFAFNMVPRPEQVAEAMEGMVMPDDPVLGMGGSSMSGNDMLKMLQQGTQETFKAVKDGSIKDILAGGDIPTDL